MIIECYENDCNHTVCDFKSFCPKQLEEYNKKIRTNIIDAILKYIESNEYDYNDLIKTIKQFY